MATNSEEQREFAKWVLNVADDNLPTIVEEEGVDPNSIEIPSHMRLPAEDYSLRGLIQTVYPDHRCHSRDVMYLMQRNILAPKNIDVDEVNNAILESLSEESHMYLSANSLTPTEEGVSVAAGVSMDSLYPVEFLNTLRFSSITNHELQLKVGVPILLLRNLNQSIGLCNGTKLIVKRLGQCVIEAEIITGNNVGKRVFIPRIIMSPSGTDWPFVLRRHQFPIRVAFAITINKSQGQTFNNVGVYLLSPVYSHGQLYVAISRVTSSANIKIFNGHGPVIHPNRTSIYF
jgi:ATP-dependent DNA helicase PIF1